MKTTLDLDDRLVVQAQKFAEAHGSTLAQLVEQALESRLGKPVPKVADARHLPVYTGHGGLKPGIDPSSNRALLDAADGDA
jgi:hypothetical protein